MANNATITWSLGTGLGNIDSIVVQRGANTDTCATLQAQVVAGTGTAVLTDTTKALTSYTDSPAAGSYRYAVFAKNTAGANVCDAGTGSSSSTVTIN